MQTALYQMPGGQINHIWTLGHVACKTVSSQGQLRPDILPTYCVMRPWGGDCSGLKVFEDFEAQVMCLEESHSKQTPNLNKIEWSLHQTQPKSTS